MQLGWGYFMNAIFVVVPNRSEANKYFFSVVNRSIIMTLICKLDVVQASFERAGVESF